MSYHPFYYIFFFINSLISDMKALDSGVDVDGEKSCVLVYADDFVLVAKNF